MLHAPSMVKHRFFSSVSRSLARGCLAVSVVVFCGLSSAFAQNSSAVKLKLDWDMMPRIGTPGVNRAKLLSGDAPVLRGRILKVRDQIAALDKSNAQKSAYLNSHEALIQRMRGVVAAQEKVIARMAAEARRPKPTMLAQAPVNAPRPAQVPRPQASTVMAPIHLGPIELPGMVRNYTTEVAFAGIVVILLGWALYLRSVVRARTAELTILKGGGLATPQAEAEPEPEVPELMPEPEPPPVVRREPAPAPVQKPPPSRPVAAPTQRSDSDTAPELEWSDTVVRHKASDPDALAEVDTLIADGDLPRAKQLLDELIKSNRDNPEHHLRLLHVASELGDASLASEQEKILSKMNQGPLSGTRERIKEIGRGLMPGHPLFDDAEKLQEAKRIISGQDSGGPADAGTPETEEPRTPIAASAQRREAPPLILDLEVDDETIDFFSDIGFDAEDGKEKKG